MELLKQLGFQNIKIINPMIEENKVKKKSIQELVVELSYLKAQSALKRIKTFNGYIISGDTEVYRCKEVFTRLTLRFRLRNIFQNYLEESTLFMVELR